MISKSFVSEKDLQEKHRIQAEEGVTDIATLSETDRKPLWQRLEEQRQREKDERLQRYSLLPQRPDAMEEAAFLMQREKEEKAKEEREKRELDSQLERFKQDKSKVVVHSTLNSDQNFGTKKRQSRNVLDTLFAKKPKTDVVKKEEKPKESISGLSLLCAYSSSDSD